MTVVTKRSVMTFYSSPTCPYCHMTRFVLAEKGLTTDVISVNPNNPPDSFREINPYLSVPTLVDRDLVLYESRVIMEYLDERFPHPPLLPIDPVSRAQSRLFMYRIKKDWYELVPKIELGNGSETEKAREKLRMSIREIAPVFIKKPYFMNNEFSLLDSVIAPLFWRLPHLGIELNHVDEEPLRKYCKRLFSRDSFQSSLTEEEMDLRDY